jgi:hypothetical protein
MRRIPEWVPVHLGELVQIRIDYNDGIREYPKGSTCRLQSIQSGRRSAYATVIFGKDGAEENMQFGDLRPLVYR